MDVTPEPDRCPHCELTLDRCNCDPGPYVCPGCHAIGGEPCAPGCIDAELERQREDDYDQEEDENDGLYDDLGVAWSTGWEDEP
jgi:hypothetical protein